MTFIVAGTVVPSPPVAPPAASSLPTSVPPNVWTGVESMTWIGYDGSRWPLLPGDDSGVLLVADKVRGWGMPEFTRYTTTTQSLPGSRWRGWNTNEREVFWPVFVYSDAGSRAWQVHNDAFWSTIGPDSVGYWEIVSALGTRRLACRFKSEEGSFDQDPSWAGWHIYGITMVAEDPFWRGDELVRDWVPDTGQRQFLPDGTDDGFFISAPFTARSAKITNPGDVVAYMVHDVHGPISPGAKIGIDGDGITIPFGLVAGEVLRIDTRPDMLTVYDGTGRNRFPELVGDVSFPPVQPGRDIPIDVEFDGSGHIVTTIEPGYFRGL